MSRNAVAAKRRKQKIKDEDLQPGIASGLTFGMSVEDAVREHSVQKIRPLEERVGHMQESAPNRVRFVAEPNDAIVNMGDGRRLQDVDVVLTAEEKNQIQAGYKCLRCFEPQEVSFPALCDLCGYPMRDRQIMDVALEFEGERHVGPRKPMGEYLDELELQGERREFFRHLLKRDRYEEARRMLKEDPSLAHGLDPVERRALGA